MTNVIDFPLSPAADRFDVTKTAPRTAPAPVRTAISPAYDGHFLSIIAFNGAITAETFAAVMRAQGDEMKRTQGRRALWRGWKLHTGEGQVRSRNECADVFLKSGCSHHFFLDADIIFRPEHVHALRRHPEAADAIICGIYCKKEDRVQHVYNSLKGGNPEPSKVGLMEVAKGATGFMQIPRSAYERIMAKFPERFYLCDYEIDDNGVRANKFSFFFHDIRPDSELGFMRDQSEDWAFCELARQAGVKIYVDVTTSTWETQETAPLLHKGSTLFPLRTELERMAAVEQLETAHRRITELEQKLSGKSPS